MCGERLCAWRAAYPRPSQKNAADEIAVSTITEMEIAYGLRLNPALSRRLRPLMDAFLTAIHVLPYDRGAASASAELGAALKRQGRPVGAYDALIAGAALAHDLTGHLESARIRTRRWIAYPGLARR